LEGELLSAEIRANGHRSAAKTTIKIELNLKLTGRIQNG
jgi:hypothetical protein